MVRKKRRKNRVIASLMMLYHRISVKSIEIYDIVTKSFRKKPLFSFFITLSILLVLIIIANILGKPRSQINNPNFAKFVSVYRVGSAPKISLPAKVQKSGVIKIVAQTTGIVQNIPVTEGDTVSKGTNLINISSNYQGGNVVDIQAQIAKDQNDNVINSYQMQQDLLDEQKKIATDSAANTVDLQQVGLQSAEDSQTLIHYDQDIINTLNQELSNYTASNSGGINSSIILQTQTLVSQFQSGINQLNSSLRQVQYQQNPLNPPLLLNALQEDITLKQLDIQKQSLALNKEISALQLSIAYLNASLMHPVSPVNGTVQRVYVTPGQYVNSGTTLLVVTANDSNLDVTAVVSMPLQLARIISRFENSILHIGNHQIKVLPRFISQDATDGNLYTVLYSIPSDVQQEVSDSGYISVDIPIGIPNTDSTIPFIPLDAIYQTQNEAYIYVVKNGIVQSKIVTLGSVYGRFVQITSGLANGDQVILDRTVIAGDKVSTN